MSTPLRPCGVCGTPARGARCAAHPARARQRRGAAKYTGAWPRLSTAVIQRDGHTCRYCGGVATTADHVVPGLPLSYLLAVPALAVATCRPCNSSKRDTDLVHCCEQPCPGRSTHSPRRTQATDRPGRTVASPAGFGFSQSQLTRNSHALAKLSCVRSPRSPPCSRSCGVTAWWAGSSRPCRKPQSSS